MMNLKGTYLIIGANGFVGSYLVDFLSMTEENTIKAFDRFSREPQFYTRNNVEVIKGDALDIDDIENCLEGVDYVIHAFSSTTPYTADSNPYKDIDDNLRTGVRIIEVCARKGVKKFGYISSAGTVYGVQAEKGVSAEDDMPLPVSPYGINKLALEYYLEYFKRKNGMSYIIWRLTNPYGPRQIMKNNQGVIPSFIDRLRQGQQLTIYGDGSTSRDYIFMADAAAMMMHSFAANNKYATYNIGRGQQTSLNELVQLLSEKLARTPHTEYVKAPESFVTHTSVSIDRYVKEFGAPDFTSLARGLELTIEGNLNQK